MISAFWHLVGRVVLVALALYGGYRLLEDVGLGPRKPLTNIEQRFNI